MTPDLEGGATTTVSSAGILLLSLNGSCKTLRTEKDRVLLSPFINPNFVTGTMISKLDGYNAMIPRECEVNVSEESRRVREWQRADSGFWGVE